MAKPRKSGRLDLPQNLLPRQRIVAGEIVIYWFWVDPRDGKEKSLQCKNDRKTAIRRAGELNSIVARAQAEEIVQKLSTISVPRIQAIPFNAWAIDYLRRIEKRSLAANTLKSRKSAINKAIAHFQDRPLHEMAEDVAACSNFLQGIEDAGKARWAKAQRSVLIDVFALAHAVGILDSRLPNPFKLTLSISAKVKRSRLTLDDFRIIWPQCEALGKRIGVWQPNSILLAMVTGQRREDIGLFQFQRGKDWNSAWLAFQLGEKHPIHPYPFVEDDFLWIVQQKTSSLVRIPLSLRLDAIGLSLGDVIERCRSSIASRHLLHHTIPFGNAPVGSQVHIDTISRQFSEARNKSGREWIGRTPPTFHELRSLSERLYRDQGVDTQTLLGHRHARTTEIYDDLRGAEWETVLV